MRRLLLAVLMVCGCSSKTSDKDQELEALRSRVPVLESQLADRTAELADKNAQIARMSAQLARLAAPPAQAADAGAPAALPTDGNDPRTRNLRSLSRYFESSIPRITTDLNINLSDVLDDYGRVRDPAALCSTLHDAFTSKYGDAGAQSMLVRAVGAEVGTQVWNGTLCDGPTITRGLAPPAPQDLATQFAARIESDAVGWARTLDVPLDELIDEHGHLRDLQGTARREHDLLDRRHQDWSRAIALFGNELGTAVHFNRVGSQ